MRNGDVPISSRLQDFCDFWKIFLVVLSHASQMRWLFVGEALVLRKVRRILAFLVLKPHAVIFSWFLWLKNLVKLKKAYIQNGKG